MSKGRCRIPKNSIQSRLPVEIAAFVLAAADIGPQRGLKWTGKRALHGLIPRVRSPSAASVRAASPALLGPPRAITEPVGSYISCVQHCGCLRILQLFEVMI
jgi:hypothetical protein